MEENKNPNGRPSKYKEEYCQQLLDYFSIEHFKENGKGEEFPMFIGFARSLKVNIDTLHEWRKVHPSFSEAYKTAKSFQEHMLVNNSLLNRYNPYFAQFILKNGHGYRDKQEIEQTVQEIKINKQDETL